MKLFNLFGRKEKETPPQESGEANDGQELDIYSGMRVEVTNFDGGILFVAKLLRLRGDKAELHQYSETSLPGEGEPFQGAAGIGHVRRGGARDGEGKFPV